MKREKEMKGGKVIETEVIDKIKVIAKAMGVGTAKADGIGLDTRFWEDLGFSAVMRRELARPMNKIVEKNGGKRMSKAEAGKWEKVKDACDLVNKKIATSQGGGK